MSTKNVHKIAEAGFGQGNQLYDRARPSYPSDALSAIRAALTKKPPYNVVELGAGTGIFTRAFLSHPDWVSVVNELRAVEPSILVLPLSPSTVSCRFTTGEGMRDQFSQKITDPARVSVAACRFTTGEGMRDQFSQKITDPARVSVAAGTFDDTHIPNGWADLIVVAQAFHWCPDYEKAAIEFNRILAPDGRVVLIWNLEDDATPWIAQLRKLIEAYEQGSPQFRLGLWRQTFDTPSYKELFKPPQELLFRHIVTGSLRGVIERAFSKSYISITPEDTKDMLTKEITGIVSRGDGKVWIDESDDTFEYPYNTTVIIIQRHL